MKKFKKFIIIFGLEHSVLWSIIIYFIWDEGPFIFTVLDAIAGIVIIHLGYRIYKDKPELISYNFAYITLVLASLIYNSLWTIVIIFFVEIDLAGLSLPLDLISLYATITMTRKIWNSAKEHYIDGDDKRGLQPHSRTG